MKKFIFALALVVVFGGVFMSFTPNKSVSQFRYVSYQCKKQFAGNCLHLLTVSNDGSNWAQVSYLENGCGYSKNDVIQLVQSGDYDNGWKGYSCY